MNGKKLVLGILAHVDAGKTTLCESILYLTGSIRKLGRVDHKNAFLDTDTLERDRGITIFSKQARFVLGDKDVTLLDTPGHADFSGEMERTLQVLDYAILVVNGADGIQAHTLTLWNLLKHYNIPVFIFVNKMDQNGTDQKALQKELQNRLDGRCVDFNQEGSAESELFWESLSMCHESLLEFYLMSGKFETNNIAQAIAERKVFPCYFGSALKVEGVTELLEGIQKYCIVPLYSENFAAKVYKITRDSRGNRLTHMKITGGTLKVKSLLEKGSLDKLSQEGGWREKVDQIRIYSGTQFDTVSEVHAGTICAVTGLSQTYCGEGLGAEASSQNPVLAPVLTYQIQPLPGTDVYGAFIKLRQLEEEEPQLHMVWNEHLNEIHVQIMGEMGIDILTSLIRERFDISVEFARRSIVYKETITNSVIGVGHFEPNGHYGEVLLFMEPGPRGSGMQFESRCSEDILDKNWQRLILTHLKEKKHVGVLTGSEITDIKITLIAGKAHKKHTEGGDFRQAVYRAVRQGLKKAQSLLLEPFFEFHLEIPQENIGRAMSDIQMMNGTFEPFESIGDTITLIGKAPVAAMGEYQNQVNSYTRGKGKLFCFLKGFEPCSNAEEIIEKTGYDPKRDLDNPSNSIFCAQGTGFLVNWDEVEQYMHIDMNPFLSYLKGSSQSSRKDCQNPRSQTLVPSLDNLNHADEKELEEIFQRTYGPVKRQRPRYKRKIQATAVENQPFPFSKNIKIGNREKYLLVDGYNIIFAWEELKELAAVNLDAARESLINILSNYQGYKNNTVIVVFDAYRVAGGQGSEIKQNNIHVIFTKEAETADQYIERTVHRISHEYDVTVATSDSLVQMIIWGKGATRLSAQGLKDEIETVNREMRAFFETSNQKRIPNYPFEKLGESISKNNLE